MYRNKPATITGSGLRSQEKRIRFAITKMAGLQAKFGPVTTD